MTGNEIRAVVACNLLRVEHVRTFDEELDFGIVLQFNKPRITRVEIQCRGKSTGISSDSYRAITGETVAVYVTRRETEIRTAVGNCEQRYLIVLRHEIESPATRFKSWPGYHAER